ncbi:MAG: hypothetical protein AAFV80_06635, partial [Bacteroidota bacterium]
MKITTLYKLYLSTYLSHPFFDQAALKGLKEEIFSKYEIQLSEFKETIDRVDQISLQSNNYNGRTLLSPFFELINEPENRKRKFVPFTTLSIKPVKGEDRAAVEAGFEHHIQRFAFKMEELNRLNFELPVFYSKFQLLCKAYLSSINCGYSTHLKKVNDPRFDVIDLFHYLKNQAALACCIKWGDPNFPFSIWCCDISGIQKFIYAIHSSKALVSLKGRSFFLHLLLDSIQKKITDRILGTRNSTNLIYSSGGKF